MSCGAMIAVDTGCARVRRRRLLQPARPFISNASEVRGGLVADADAVVCPASTIAGVALSRPITVPHVERHRVVSDDRGVLLLREDDDLKPAVGHVRRKRRRAVRSYELAPSRVLAADAGLQVRCQGEGLRVRCALCPHPLCRLQAHVGLARHARVRVTSQTGLAALCGQ